MHSYHLVLAIVGFLVVGLYSNWAKPTILFLIAIFVILVLGVLSPEEALKGLANKQVAIIFLLTILVAGFRKTFGNEFFSFLFKSSLKPKQFLLRLMILVSSTSIFINNTPIVAFMVPYVKEWVDSKQWPVSKFMIPLAFSTVLGGMVTVVGTSTNLLLNG
jgi:Na+/H+ antiporter NhaD/arsenite permease-like protein